MNLKQEKQELYNFIYELHHNRDGYSRTKLLEMVKNKIRETIPNTILSEHNDNIDTSDSNCIIPVVSNSFCECKAPKYNYPEMLWCDTCGKKINEDKQKEELLIAYTKWQYQDDSFNEADKLMVKTFLKDYKGNL